MLTVLILPETSLEDIFMAFIFFIPYVRSASALYADKQHLLETKIPELAERDLPPNCVIVVEFPVVLEATTNLRAVSTVSFLENPGKIFN